MKAFTINGMVVENKIAVARPLPCIALGNARIRLSPAFDARLSAITIASPGFDHRAVLRPVGEDPKTDKQYHSWAAVLLNPGPGAWIPTRPCPLRGVVISGKYTCPLCNISLPANRRSALFNSPRNIHPQAGFRPAIISPGEDIHVLYDHRVEVDHFIRLVAVRPHCPLYLSQHPSRPEDRRFLNYDGKNLKFGTEAEVFGSVLETAVA